MAAALQERLQREVDTLQKLQTDIQKAVQNRTQLEAQLQENSLVKQELDLVKDDSRVYKQIGPALIKQDVNEARQNVTKRIEFITNEIKRSEKSVSDMEATMNKHRTEAMKLQQQLQQQPR